MSELLIKDCYLFHIKNKSKIFLFLYSISWLCGCFYFVRNSAICLLKLVTIVYDVINFIINLSNQAVFLHDQKVKAKL